MTATLQLQPAVPSSLAAKVKQPRRATEKQLINEWAKGGNALGAEMLAYQRQLAASYGKTAPKS